MNPFTATAKPHRPKPLLSLSSSSPLPSCPSHYHSRTRSFLPGPKRAPRFRILALDAAQPFDREAQLRSKHLQSQSLKIAILGFGNFGQFLAKTFAAQGHTILAHSRTDYSAVARSLGVRFFLNPDDLCEAHPDVVVLATSILSSEKVLSSFPLQRLRRSTLFVDVLSVKEFARTILLRYLPGEFDVLCTHPMFGPESGKNSWSGLPFVYDKVRMGPGDDRSSRCDRFLRIFEKEGCRMVEMTCAEHDMHAAGSQFVTHTMGRVLEQFMLESSPINTKGYEMLLDLVKNTAGDSFELYYGLFLYNKNAIVILERLDMAFEMIKKELFGKLHQVHRQQLFGSDDDDGGRREEVQRLLGNGKSSGEEST